MDGSNLVEKRNIKFESNKKLKKKKKYLKVCSEQGNRSFTYHEKVIKDELWPCL